MPKTYDIHTSQTRRCECSDPHCMVHAEEYVCPFEESVTVRLFDMEDGNTTFEFCEECAQDALNSGVFTIDDDSEEEANNE